MSFQRRVVASAMGIALVAAACGGATSSPAASAGQGAGTPPASQPAQSIDTPTATPADTPAPSDAGFEPSYVPGAAADLEAMIPDSAGGITYAKVSFDGASLGAAGLGIDSGELDPILKANGKTIDVRVAIATPATASATDLSEVVAFQVKGIDASQLIPLVSASGGSSSMTPATIAGKQVLQTAEAGYSSVAYVKGDVLFLVILASQAQTEAIIAALP